MNKSNEFFQDSCGAYSMSRLMAFLLVVVFLCLAGIVTAQNKAIPDIPMGWAALIATLYGTNKWFSNKEEPKP